MPEAIETGWGAIINNQFYTGDQIPKDATPGKIFEQAGREMLILGDPGSGKTTLLLQMTEYLIDRADVDENQPIPIILNLSSWSNERCSFDKWILNELVAKYQVPLKLGRMFLEKGEFLLMLDGLDEVDAHFQSDCIISINDYRSQKMLDMVVCCRIDDYRAMNKLLKLQAALVIQPLTYAQIDNHLSKFGERFSFIEKCNSRGRKYPTIDFQSINVKYRRFCLW